MNTKTIVALYDDLDGASRVLADLETAGLRRDFTIVGGATAKSAPALAGAHQHGSSSFSESFGADHDAPTNRVSTLTRLGVPQDDAQVYCEGVRRGGVLIVGRIADGRVDEALEIIERHNPVDPSERGASYRQSGWTGYDANATDYTDTQVTEERSRYGMGLGAAAHEMRDVNATSSTSTNSSSTARSTGGTREESIPIAEEHLHIGKREVARGALRVRSYVVETPVEEQVTLRDETVHVERRAVDRAAGDMGDVFQERSIEVTETDEEAVVAKNVRVKEELVIRKDVEERAQTVSDTVRRTEVEIDDTRNSANRADVNRTDIDRTDKDRRDL